MIIVLFGQPHSGKTTLSNSINADYYIDGDHLRTMFNNKDYSKQGRINNLNRASDIATYLHYNNNDVLLSLVYPYKEARDYLNSLVDNVKWIYLTYTEPRGREEFHVADFDEPELENFMQINTDNLTIKETITKIIQYVG
jgi:adenylylsulfate kinase-like enzyme